MQHAGDIKQRLILKNQFDQFLELELEFRFGCGQDSIICWSKTLMNTY